MRIIQPGDSFHPVYFQEASRVHGLSKMSMLDLRTLYIRMVAEPGSKSGAHFEETASAGWDRDRLIAAIRELEDAVGR